MFDTIERERVNQIAIVGDAFGKPMLKALDEYLRRWDLASLFLVASSGVMFSEPVKQALLRHHPNMLLVDAFSSEAIGMGQSVSSGTSASNTAKFVLGENTIVITDDGRRVEPGSDDIGRVAVGGHQPIGYYKDPEKTAATFIEFEGRRYSCPGDYARVEADGSLTLLGRGSVVINTGGEKVFPEEVEEALKTYPGIRDAVAVGIPDDRFGEVVTAVVGCGRRRCRARGRHRPRPVQAGRLQGAEAGLRHRHHRPRPTARSTTSACGRTRSRTRRAPDRASDGSRRPDPCAIRRGTVAAVSEPFEPPGAAAAVPPGAR